MSDPQHHVSPDRKHAVASAGPVFVFFSRHPPDLASVRWIALHFRRHRVAFPGGYAVISYNEPDPGARPGMVGDARQEFLDSFRAGAADARAVLVVFTRDGFVGAAFRAFLAGMLLALRLPAPVKVVRSLDEGQHWLADLLRRSNTTSDAAQVRSVIERMRADTVAATR
jgi:hypothetical protein